MKRTIIVTWWAGFIGSNFLNKYVLLFPENDYVNVDCLTYAWKLEHLSDEVKNAIKNNKHLLEKLSASRKKEELDKIFGSKKAYEGIKLIQEAIQEEVQNRGLVLCGS